ncbi:MAG: TonB family protein [Pyrinomonadaceae bacterium]
MFDKLIVTEPEGADFKNRSRYFMVSTLVVGVFFATAVVFSIYAAEVGLGNRDFELVSMLAPPEMVTEPEQIQRPLPRTQSATTTSDLPSRQSIMSRVDEPTIVPTTTSTVANSRLSRPPGSYILGPIDTTPAGVEIGRNISPTVSGPGGITSSTAVITPDEETTPPPVKVDPPAIKKPVVQSLGVINGRASNLPKPNYPATAKMVGASGKVSIQVLIDENGRVVSAKSADGHPLLRPAAEEAARRASFTPTLLSGVPVKVTGIIVYNFTK